jgi:hypothetical protein
LCFYRRRLRELLRLFEVLRRFAALRRFFAIGVKNNCKLSKRAVFLPTYKEKLYMHLNYRAQKIFYNKNLRKSVENFF